MPTDLPRTRFNLDHAEFKQLFDLALERQWLRTKSQALTDLWQLCDTAEKKELMLELLRRFHILEFGEIEGLCDAIAKQVMTVWNVSPKRTLVVAVSDDAAVDGSQMALNFLKNHFKEADGWKETSFRNTMARYDDYLESDRTYILLDDFAGTGRTITRKLGHFRAAISERKLSNVSIYVVALAAMEKAKPSLDDAKVGYFAPLWLKKGIDDHNNEAEANLKRRLMVELEKALMNKVNGQFLPRLGYGGSQSLFSIGGINCPNNVFPLFWWPKYHDKSDRNTVLRRFR